MNIQIANLARGYTVLVNGVAHGRYETLGAAQKAALELRENV